MECRLARNVAGRPRGSRQLRVRVHAYGNDLPSENVRPRGSEWRPKKRKNPESHDEKKQKSVVDTVRQIKPRKPSRMELGHLVGIGGLLGAGLALMAIPDTVCTVVTAEYATVGVIAVARQLGSILLAASVLAIAIMKLPHTYRSSKIAYAGMAGFGLSTFVSWAAATVIGVLPFLPCVLMCLYGLYYLSFYGSLFMWH